MTVIEKQYMDAVIAMNRKMADQNKVDWERYRMDTAQKVVTNCMGLYFIQPEDERPALLTIVEIAIKVADALVAELQNNPLNTKNDGNG